MCPKGKEICCLPLPYHLAPYYLKPSTFYHSEEYWSVIPCGQTAHYNIALAPSEQGTLSSSMPDTIGSNESKTQGQKEN